MVDDPGYPVIDSGNGLEAVWGRGFLSPGGPAEVARIVGGADLTGQAVLDVGCGLGGPGLALVANHGAARVVGVDVQQSLVDEARARADEAGLGERLAYALIVPDRPLPFGDGEFDVVFSKDAIIHVADKRSLYAELSRVLGPGGRLLVGDWLRGRGAELDEQVTAFVEAAGHTFTMVTLDDLEVTATEAGFVDVELEDRRDWYLREARAERRRLPAEEREFWDVLVRSPELGALRPGHLRAVRA